MSFPQKASTPSLSKVEDSVSSTPSEDSTSITPSCEQGLLGLANAIRVLLCHSNLSAAFPRALEHVRASLQVNRLYICEHKGAGFSLKYEAVPHPSTSCISDEKWQIESYEESGLGHWLSNFRSRRSVGGIGQGFSEVERQLLGADSHRFHWLTPIYVMDGGELWGFLGCEHQHPPPNFGSCEQPLLLSLADNLGCAISRRRGEQQMQHRAFHDLLTGLPNRVLFNDRLPLAIAHARRTQEPVAVMFLDLDKFKQINDTLGHDYGDQVLIEASERLKACLREDDILARWGGDEFTLCLPSLQSSDDVIKVCQRILTTLRKPFKVTGKSLEISGSIGIAIYPQDGEETDVLLRNADAALYRVKEQGRDHYQFFQAEMNVWVTEQQFWRQALSQALKKDQSQQMQQAQIPQEFELYYQPLVRIVGDQPQVYALEALLHWHHPELGQLMGLDFLTHVEQTGLMIELGEWMIEAAIAQLRIWWEAGLELKFISINLSEAQFHAPEIIAKLTEDVRPDCPIQLMLELDETIIYQDVDYAYNVSQELSEKRIGLVMQRFGANPVAIKTLLQLPINRLKLDRDLTEGLTDETGEASDEIRSDKLSLISALLAIAKRLKIPAVAEGVESQAQLNVLQQLNCLEFQGSVWGPPLTAKEAQALLKRRAT